MKITNVAGVVPNSNKNEILVLKCFNYHQNLYWEYIFVSKIQGGGNIFFSSRTILKKNTKKYKNKYKNA